MDTEQAHKTVFKAIEAKYKREVEEITAKQKLIRLDTIHDFLMADLITANKRLNKFYSDHNYKKPNMNEFLDNE